MRRCVICKQEKDESEYNKKSNSKDGLQIHCRECNRAKSRDYYQANQEKHKTVAVERKKKVIAENRKLVFDHYLANPCVDCGETDPVVLELDHLRDKDMPVSQAAHRGWSKKRLLDEIAKCEVRCANCHRRKTAKDQGWYKNLLGS
jgi:hypothetical protein